jgi:hypothetical protein
MRPAVCVVGLGVGSVYHVGCLGQVMGRRRRSFDLWPQDGTIIFRHAMIFPDAETSAAQCEALLNLALEACEHYYPAFQFVLWGGKTAEDAIASAVLECAGQA